MVEQMLFGKPPWLDMGELLHTYQNPPQLLLPEEACPDHFHGPAWIQHSELDPYDAAVANRLSAYFW